MINLKSFVMLSSFNYRMCMVELYRRLVIILRKIDDSFNFTLMGKKLNLIYS